MTPPSETPPPERPKSFYDVSTPEEDLWFLPDNTVTDEPSDIPLPKAGREGLFNTGDWTNAERANYAALIKAAMAYARIDEAIRQSPPGRRPGLIRRLAIAEASGMSWAEGTRLEVERLVLYLHLRLGSGDDAKSLSISDWAVRRLCGASVPAEGLSRFVGRIEPSAPQTPFNEKADLLIGPQGDAFAEGAGDWQDIMADKLDLHPFTQAALGYFAWQALEISGEMGSMEAAVAAAKIGGEAGRGVTKESGIPFMPLALGGRVFWHFSGSPDDRLSAWYGQVEEACLAGLRMLDQLKTWQEKAQKLTGDLSGRIPPAMIEAIIANPVLSVVIVAELASCSRAAALRNLTMFEERGIIREITGQGRYRFWAVKL